MTWRPINELYEPHVHTHRAKSWYEEWTIAIKHFHHLCVKLHGGHVHKWFTFLLFPFFIQSTILPAFLTDDTVGIPYRVCFCTIGALCWLTIPLAPVIFPFVVLPIASFYSFHIRKDRHVVSDLRMVEYAWNFNIHFP